MARPRFSEMLLERRHRLGLSIAQASSVLKLREDVLVAFEEGDFDAMPQSGYAQGMLSSYSRYLGLNPREVTDVFQEELYEHRHGQGSHELRRRARDTQSGRVISGYEEANSASSRPKSYVEYKPLLPSGGGPAGDIEGFTTTSEASPHRSVPLVNSSLPAASRPGSSTGYGASYVYARGAQSGSDRASAGAQGAYASRAADEQRPYNSRQEHRSTSPAAARRRVQSQRRRAQASPADRLMSEGRRSGYEGDQGRARPASERLYWRDDVSYRSVSPSEYKDDMRYDDEARPYASAATLSGRRSSRSIASVERPNVRRRQASKGNGRRGSSGRGRRGGVAGWFSADPRRTLFLIIVLLAAVLTCILIFSVSSCVNQGSASTSGGQTIQVTSATSQNDDDSSAGDDAQDDESSDATDAAATDATATDATDADATDAADADATDADATATDGEDDAEQEVEPTVVTVSVESGKITWLEINSDGTSAIATNVTGPWEQSFTVTDVIEVQASVPDYVTVTNNGEKVEFSKKTSGVGTVTIKGTPVSQTSEDGSEDADAAGTTDSTTE